MKLWGWHAMFEPLPSRTLSVSGCFFLCLLFDEDHMIQDTEMSDFKQADPHNQTSAVTFGGFAQHAVVPIMFASWYCVSTLPRRARQSSTERRWQARADKSKVKQRAARRWPHSRAWLVVVVVATLIFFFLPVASDKCWALFPLATEKSRCGGVKLMYTSHSHSLAGSD